MLGNIKTHVTANESLTAACTDGLELAVLVFVGYSKRYWVTCNSQWCWFFFVTVRRRPIGTFLVTGSDILQYVGCRQQCWFFCWLQQEVLVNVVSRVLFGLLVTVSGSGQRVS